MMIWMLACALDSTPSPTPAPTTTPAEEVRAPAAASIYALEVPLTTQEGEARSLDLERGNPVIFSMFYTSCPMACPLLIEDIQALEAELSDAERARLRVVLVSMDPARDTPAAMQEVVQRHSINARWTLGAVPEASVREVAAVLGVRYRPLPDGGFAHTSVLTLVDGEGRILARSEGQEGRPALLDAARAAAGSGS